MERVTIYTDGSCMPNPGKAGYAAILIHEASGRSKEVTGSAPRMTNNVAEIMAVRIGIEALKEPCAVTVISDSTYVVNILNGESRFSVNADVWQGVFNLIYYGKHQVKAVWVRGHAGDPNNERVHELALAAQRGVKEAI